MEEPTSFALCNFDQTLVTVAVGFAGTVVGALIPAITSVFLDRLRRRGAKEYQAMLVASHLDQLVTDCLEIVDDPMGGGSGGIYPTIADAEISWPAEIDWQTLPSKSMFRCLAMPLKTKAASRATTYWLVEYDDKISPSHRDKLLKERELLFSRIGLEAYDVLQDLRAKYGVLAPTDEHRQPKEAFEATIKSSEQFLEKNAERRK